MTNQSPSLYIVLLKVTPTPMHPLYFEFSFGVLHVWLHATCNDEAVSRAEAVCEHLPYSIEGEMRGVKHIEKPEALPERFQKSIGEARSVGIAFFLAAAATGVEDIDFDQFLKEWTR